MVGWVAGWSEDWRVMLNSTQDQVEVEVEVRVELGNKYLLVVHTSNNLALLVTTENRNNWYHE